MQVLHAAMPAPRLPAGDATFDGAYLYNRPYETKRNEFLLPADDELLAAPEITPVPRHQMSVGTQARIRQILHFM